MELEEYYFDTYAFYEIIRGNENYLGFLAGKAAITTRLNLMELYYGLLRDFDKSTAEKYFERFKGYCIDFSDELIKAAMKFKLENRKKDLSYVDCIGYLIARTKNAKFLTGDEKFENLENVAFVK